MSDTHGDKGPQRPIKETAEYLKKVLPAEIPEDFELCENIRAFRDFLGRVYDRLITDGDVYVTPQKNPKNPTDYPFLNYITFLLIDIGFHGTLSSDGRTGTKITVNGMPEITASMTDSGKVFKHKIPAARQAECLRFLSSCGLVFEGADLSAKALDLMNTGPVVITYPDNPLMLTGLKAMALANSEPRGDRWRNGWRNNDVFMRCDYRILIPGEVNTFDALKSFLHPLDGAVRDFALGLHKRFTDKGMSCLPFMSLFDMHFCYWYEKKTKRAPKASDIFQERIWEIALNPKFGFYLVIRSKHTDEYRNVTESFPPELRDMINAGYGCDRKRGWPCRYGCQGFRIPLDITVLDIAKEIQVWLDSEAGCY